MKLNRNFIRVKVTSELAILYQFKMAAMKRAHSNVANEFQCSALHQSGGSEMHKSVRCNQAITDATSYLVEIQKKQPSVELFRLDQKS